MSYWLFKSDPDTYGYDDLEREKQTTWDGVANPVAMKNLRACKKGDSVFIYHTGDEKTIVGLAEIVKEGDPPQIKAKGRLKKSVSLADVKARKEFADFALVRQPRLSVMPVTQKQWNGLLEMAGSAP